MTDKEKLDAILAAEEADKNQVEEVSTEQVEEPVKNDASEMIGQRLHVNPATGRPWDDEINNKEMTKRKGLSRVGESIIESAEVRDGWIDVDRARLGDRNVFYPEDWRFRIRPATVEAIRNWSMIDDENPLSIDDVFNEVLKSCLAIITPEGPKPWGNVCSWDRFFWLLMIREYTFKQGEHSVSYEEDCPECDNPVKFELLSFALSYDLPDPEVMPMYDQEERQWHIDPNEYNVEMDPFTLYIPTLEKDQNIKNWLIARANENPNKKFDPVFLKFAPWMTNKISKDDNIAKRQMKELEMRFKSWDVEQFRFVDEVIRNVLVIPDKNLKSVCTVCGEEVTSPIRFPNSISSLFSVQSKHRKFGTK